MTCLIKPLTLAQVTEQMRTQLAESGLSPNQKGYKPLLTPPAGLTSHPAPGYQIVYHDRNGRPTKFYRYRYVRPPKPFGKPLRYVQPSAVLPQVYWSLETPWTKALADKDIPLFITEGEKKADCGCKNGFATIGLGGVWNFKSRTVELIEELATIDWEGRRVYIVYDSDAASNPSVLLAERRLGEQLLSRKAIVLTIRLPEGSTGKVAMDDFIVANGAEEFQRLVDNDFEEFENSKALHALNEEVCYIENPSAIVRLDNRQVMSCHTFVNEAFRPRTHTVMEAMPKGGEKAVIKRTAKEWLGWPGRSTVERLAYEPGQPTITDRRELNGWRGWGTEPREGDIKPWIKLLDFLCKGIEAEHRRWFEQWLAYPIQYPGTKLYSGVVMWGRDQGTGKSLLGYTMGKLYGENFAEIGNEQLESSYNASWARNRQFIMGDEIVTDDNYRRAVYNRMKAWITQMMMRVTEKYVPDYTVRDCINYYFTSNSPDAFYLADEDRRFFVIEVKDAAMEKSVYDDFIDWRDNRGGAEALMYHMLHLDLEGFNPTTRPPDTRAKLEMIAGGRSHVEVWAEAVTQAPDEMLRRREVKTLEQMSKPAPAYNLYTISELAEIARSHQSDEKTYITEATLGKALAKFKFSKVRCSADGRIPLLGSLQAVWVMRDAKRLLKVTDPAKIRAEYQKERQ
jgi:hypothetical protein